MNRNYFCRYTMYSDRYAYKLEKALEKNEIKTLQDLTNCLGFNDTIIPHEIHDIMIIGSNIFIDTYEPLNVSFTRLIDNQPIYFAIIIYYDINNNLYCKTRGGGEYILVDRDTLDCTTYPNFNISESGAVKGASNIYGFPYDMEKEYTLEEINIILDYYNAEIHEIHELINSEELIKMVNKID